MATDKKSHRERKNPGARDGYRADAQERNAARPRQMWLGEPYNRWVRPSAEAQAAATRIIEAERAAQLG
jgi:hypothetical protein